MIILPTAEEMLKSGVHFGHKKERTHPKAKKFIFAIREGIYIIDLDKTQQMLKNSLSYIAEETKKGKTFMFVGTKRQSREIIKNAAEKTAMPYVNERWLGGTLTNFETIRKSIKKLEQLEEKVLTEDFQKLRKKEKRQAEKELAVLRNNLSGLRQMSGLPDVLFVVDTSTENTAVTEAKNLHIPIVGICDTDANPDLIDWAIPANDDARKSIELIVNLVAETILANKPKAKEDKLKDKNKKTTPITSA